ncbi:MAG: leucine-rich repeat domain-containing protein [Verrucomicrobia bacterium]|nr:leucine-rich repeat domain-containing protein [Verrucomicrobiota bacterium]
MQNLFTQVRSLVTTSENPKVIAKLSHFLDRIESEVKKSDPRCLRIFINVIQTMHAKLGSLSINPLLEKAVGEECELGELLFLPIEKRRLLSDQKISRVLGLDTWKGEGNIDEARVRIIKCFRNNSVSLDLASLSLTQIPTQALKYLPQLEGLTIASNKLTDIDLRYQSNLTGLDLRYNELTNIDLTHQSKLTTLNLSNNQLTAIDLTHQSNLRTLDLTNNQLTEMPDITVFNPLRAVNFEGDPVLIYDINLQSFKNKLPATSEFKSFDLLPLKKKNRALFNLIADWLNRLKMAHDFNEISLAKQAVFVTRIFSILDCAIKHSEFQEVLQIALQEATISCVDRAAYFLNNLELNKLLFESRNLPLTEVLLLLKGVFALEKLHEISTEFVNRKKVAISSHDLHRYSGDEVSYIDGQPYRDEVDPIEVYLGFQIRFKEDFKLPIVTEGLNFDRCSGIKSEDEIWARKKLDLKINEPGAFINYLTSVNAWQERIKQEFSKDLRKILEPFYEELEEKTQEESYLAANGDEQKALLEPTHTRMRQAEEAFIQAKTLEIVR